MTQSLDWIRTWRQKPDFDGEPPAADPPGDPVATAKSDRAAAEARYQAFVAGGAPRAGDGDDPCLDFAAPGFGVDHCVASPIPDAVLFRQEPGDTAAIDPNDVHQGWFGDCYVLASLAALATTPSGRALLRSTVVENKNDAGSVVSWTVTLHHPEEHLFRATTFQDVQVTVDAAFARGHAVARPVDGPPDEPREVWPLVLEKAYAVYAGGYGKIAYGGTSLDAMSVLTGRQAQREAFGAVGWLSRSYDADQLQRDFASGKALVLASKTTIGDGSTPDATTDGAQDGAGPYGLYGGHAYFVRGFEECDGRAFVILGNPWASHQPAPIPCDELDAWFSSVTVGSAP